MEKRMIKVKLAVIATAVTLCMAGCGKPSASDTFMVKSTTYKLEKWERVPELDFGAMKGYGLCLLKTGTDLPV